ncbi:hypothetical protein D623_10017707 [Myotis brandtii]|uniref:Uncharacterized protein n=1 Tax=Myotis brandtii TaxID=109478 RepID=S7NHJ7_MYOBR|nr:hypothetical protein D623_10017707 [Myotis brandtii]
MVLSAVDGRMAYLEGSYSGYMGFWINCKYKCANVGQVTGFLVILSMTLFVANCQALRPKPRISYLFTSYLCWGSGALILWTGVLSYLNYAGMWSQASFSWDRRVSYWRWASRLGSGSVRHMSRQSDSDRKSSSLPGQGIPAKPP